MIIEFQTQLEIGEITSDNIFKTPGYLCTYFRQAVIVFQQTFFICCKNSFRAEPQSKRYFSEFVVQVWFSVENKLIIFRVFNVDTGNPEFGNNFRSQFADDICMPFPVIIKMNNIDQSGFK